MERDIFKIRTSFAAYSVEILKIRIVSSAPPRLEFEIRIRGLDSGGRYIRWVSGCSLMRTEVFRGISLAPFRRSLPGGVDTRSMNVIVIGWSSIFILRR